MYVRTCVFKMVAGRRTRKELLLPVLDHVYYCHRETRVKFAKTELCH